MLETRDTAEGHWDKEDPSGFLQLDTRTSASGLAVSATESRIWFLLNERMLGFSSRQHVFYQDHSRPPLGFLPALEWMNLAFSGSHPTLLK